MYKYVHSHEKQQPWFFKQQPCFFFFCFFFSFSAHSLGGTPSHIECVALSPPLFTERSFTGEAGRARGRGARVRARSFYVYFVRVCCWSPRTAPYMQDVS